MMIRTLVGIILLSFIACKHYLVEVEKGDRQEEGPGYPTPRRLGELTLQSISLHTALNTSYPIILQNIEHQLSHNPSISLWNATIPDISKCRPTPGVSGPCRMYIPMWTYDNGVCRRFVYGGCQGNKNRFRTKLWCRLKCTYIWG